MTEITELRAAHYRALHGRPSQRRNAESANHRVTEGFAVSLAAPQASIVVREAGEDAGRVPFTGYASKTNQAYEMYDMFGPYDEIVLGGAFEHTLAQTGLRVPLVVQHKQDQRMASTWTGDLRLEEDGLGLRAEADLDPDNHWNSIYIPQMRSGLMNEMSFAFRIVRGSWDDEFVTYTIEEVDIDRGDVALVGFGANPYTEAGVREQPTPLKTRRLVRPDELRDRLV